MPSPGCAGRDAPLFQLGHGGHVGVDTDHVIQEARGQRHRLGQPVPVHMPVGVRCWARLILPRQQFQKDPETAHRRGWSTPTRTGAGRDSRGWPCPERARPARRCGEPDARSGQRVTGTHRVPDLAIVRVDQLEVAVVLHCAHEGVGDADRNVEVGDGVLIGLAGDEFADVGMINT